MGAYAEAIVRLGLPAPRQALISPRSPPTRLPAPNRRLSPLCQAGGESARVASPPLPSLAEVATGTAAAVHTGRSSWDAPSSNSARSAPCALKKSVSAMTQEASAHVDGKRAGIRTEQGSPMLQTGPPRLAVYLVLHLVSA